MNIFKPIRISQQTQLFLKSLPSWELMNHNLVTGYAIADGPMFEGFGGKVLIDFGDRARNWNLPRQLGEDYVKNGVDKKNDHDENVIWCVGRYAYSKLRMGEGKEEKRAQYLRDFWIKHCGNVTRKIEALIQKYVWWGVDRTQRIQKKKISSRSKYTFDVPGYDDRHLNELRAQNAEFRIMDAFKFFGMATVSDCINFEFDKSKVVPSMRAVCRKAGCHRNTLLKVLEMDAYQHQKKLLFGRLATPEASKIRDSVLPACANLRSFFDLYFSEIESNLDQLTEQEKNSYKKLAHMDSKNPQPCGLVGAANLQNMANWYESPCPVETSKYFAEETKGIPIAGIWRLKRDYFYCFYDERKKFWQWWDVYGHKLDPDNTIAHLRPSEELIPNQKKDPIFPSVVEQADFRNYRAHRRYVRQSTGADCTCGSCVGYYQVAYPHWKEFDI